MKGLLPPPPAMSGIWWSGNFGMGLSGCVLIQWSAGVAQNYFHSSKTITISYMELLQKQHFESFCVKEILTVNISYSEWLNYL